MYFRRQSGFTLIELLVVIAIIAILAVVVVLTLNPAQLLAESRDANRVSDMATLNSAINLYTTDQAGASTYTLGNSTTSYLSIPSASSTCATLGLATSAYSYQCSTSANYRNASTSGWLPIAFNSISSGSPFGSVPVDPVNQTSSNLYYTYETGGGKYALSAFMESSKYAKNMENTGGTDPALYEIGSGVTTLPDASRGLVGYWPLNEGTGSTAYDWSGNGNNDNFVGAVAWINGQIGGGATIPTSDSMSIPYTGPYPQNAITVAAWINLPANYSFPNYLQNRWVVVPGSWLLYSSSAGNLIFGVTGPATTTQNNAVGCSITTSAWHFAVGTYDGNTVKAYLDGTLCGTAPLSGQALAQPNTLASAASGGSGAYSMDDIRLYNRALSAAEIQEIYNAEK